MQIIYYMLYQTNYVQLIAVSGIELLLLSYNNYTRLFYLITQSYRFLYSFNNYYDQP